MKTCNKHGEAILFTFRPSIETSHRHRWLIPILRRKMQPIRRRLPGGDKKSIAKEKMNPEEAALVEVVLPEENPAALVDLVLPEENQDQPPLVDLVLPEENQDQPPLVDLVPPEENQDQPPVVDAVNPVVAPLGERIQINRDYRLNIVEYQPRPTAPWAARYGPGGPLAPQVHAELTDLELMNGFQVTLVFNNLINVPELARSIVVYGRESIEEVCRKVFIALEKSGRWDHGRNYALFFRTQSERLYIPAGTLIGEVLKGYSDDEAGVSLTLDCLLAEPNPFHGIFAIIPPAGAA